MYQRLVGKLIYLSDTRPDIAYAVSVITYPVLHFLKGTPGKGILLKKHDYLTLEVYTDADYAGSIVDRRSTSGYCTFLRDNLIT
ncbi:unnamed protein product [Spirodela intermedia]|uniref:Uncharacterized protein n=2 Tax=Spirodela intermedia TaxID=51605 RepID=A0A7I8KUY1_SPIIN|nr:unnamed protein product [Spirodela intermedia]CAA6664257.1 unnamed protein product [Spirodela intermedia]CAA7400805.1 unnamed protein product [Spirodela intermedia]